MKFQPNIVLWETNVGSHMWKMNRPDSDIDIYRCYLVDFRSFLIGNTHMSGHQSITETVDTSSFELGHIVQQVKKSNLNHLLGVMSPEILITTPIFEQLRKIVESHPCKNAFYSIQGLAKHNIKHFLEEKKQGVADDSKLFFKKLNTITRTLRFGITLLETGRFEFKPTNNTDPQSAYDLLKDLQNAYKNSSLPEEVDSDIYEEFLLSTRLDYAESFLK